MERVVEREWLDEMAASDPRAVASRRDIVRLNRVMGHGGIVRRLLGTGMAGRTPARIVELGAGDGAFTLGLAKYFSRRWKSVEVLLVDSKKAVSDKTRAEFTALGWPVEPVTADVFDWLKQPMQPGDAIIANLFLHHFTDDRLAEMLRLIASRTAVFAACEPRRAGLPLFFSRLVGLVGCNAVTRHDAVVSARAGFSGAELGALWPKSPGWQLQEGRAGLFSHAFLARSTDH